MKDWQFVFLAGALVGISAELNGMNGDIVFQLFGNILAITFMIVGAVCLYFDR